MFAEYEISVCTGKVTGMSAHIWVIPAFVVCVMHSWS